MRCYECKNKNKNFFIATLRTKDLRNYVTSNLDVSSYIRMSKQNTDTVGILNGPIQFKSARKIWPFRAKITRVLTCSRSQNFCNCLHVRILVNMCSIPRNFVNPQKRWVAGYHQIPKRFHFC